MTGRFALVRFSTRTRTTTAKGCHAGTDGNHAAKSTMATRPSKTGIRAFISTTSIRRAPPAQRPLARSRPCPRSLWAAGRSRAWGCHPCSAVDRQRPRRVPEASSRPGQELYRLLLPRVMCPAAIGEWCPRDHCIQRRAHTGLALDAKRAADDLQPLAHALQPIPTVALR